MDEMPQINTSPSQTATGASGGLLRAAGRLVAIQTEQTKLLQITIPRLYAALGKTIYGNTALRKDFPDEVEAIETLRTEQRNIEATAKDRPAGTSLVDKAKKAAMEATKVAQKQVIDVRIFQAMAALGTKAYASLGTNAGAPEDISPLASALSRSADLRREMGELEKQSRGQVLRPRLLVFAAVGLGGLVLGGLALSGRGGSNPVEQETREPSNVGSNHNTAGGASDGHGFSQHYRDAYKQGEAAARHWVTQIEKAQERGLPPQAIAQYVKSLNMVVDQYGRTFTAAVQLRQQGGRPTAATERCRGLYEGARDAAGRYAR